jgi:serine O-acetyltransferase
MEGSNDKASREEFRRRIRSRHPPFLRAVAADARVTALHRQERSEFRNRADTALQVLRLAWTTDAFLAQVFYRAKARLQQLGVPLLPRLLHYLAKASGNVVIGNSAVVAPGVHILHGDVVIDGVTRIEPGVVIAPFVTVGLRAGTITGPVVEANVIIGTGAKVIGPVNVGAGARIGANAVVVSDVPAGATVVGAPARPTESEVVAT